MIDYFWFPYLFLNFLDGISFLNYYEPCPFVEQVCFCHVSFRSALLFLCFSLKSLVIILLIFCRSDSATLNFPYRSISMSVSSNSSPVRFTILSLIIDPVVSIRICKWSVVFFKLLHFETKCSFFFIKWFFVVISNGNHL